METFVALIKSIPKLIDLADKFVDMWILWRIDSQKDQLDANRKKLLYLKAKVREAKSDEERIALSIILHDYYVGKV